MYKTIIMSLSRPLERYTPQAIACVKHILLVTYILLYYIGTPRYCFKVNAEKISIFRHEPRKETILIIQSLELSIF